MQIQLPKYLVHLTEAFLALRERYPLRPPSQAAAHGLLLFQAIAQLHGGQCLSEVYRGSMQRYRFRCARGHEWETNGYRTLQGSWCGKCGDIAIAKTNQRADGLLLLQQAAAAKGGVCLSETYAGVKKRYRFRCAHNHEWEAVGTDILDGFWCRKCGYIVTAQKNKQRAGGLARFRQAAVAKGGACLSDTYAGHDARYRFRCAQGHEWESTGSNILKGSWCKKCADAAQALNRLRPGGLARLQQAAAARGGVCLSDTDAGVNARYRFRCAHGHEWETRGARILNDGCWCGKCAHAASARNYQHPEGLARLQQAAATQGGVCLSDAYMGNKARYRFRCAHGHEWETKGADIAKGSWCPACHYATKRLSIEDAQAAAHARGGQCLSETYVNSHTKLTWMCDRGHVWQAPLTSIRNGGYWCPECANMAQISNRKSKARARYGVSTRHKPDTLPSDAATEKNGK